MTWQVGLQFKYRQFINKTSIFQVLVSFVTLINIFFVILRLKNREEKSSNNKQGIKNKNLPETTQMVFSLPTVIMLKQLMRKKSNLENEPWVIM